MSSSDEPCMVKPTLIDLNDFELKYYLFVISLDKCSVYTIWEYWNILFTQRLDIIQNICEFPVIVTQKIIHEDLIKF